VSVALVTLNNGDQYHAVQDVNGKPIDIIGEKTGIDKNQQAQFNRGETQTQRGDQEGDTRGPQNGPTREVYRGGRWTTEANPLYQGATAAGRNEPDREGPEGTPIKDAQGKVVDYDNARPVWVSHWPDGRITYRPLTEPERQRWERDKNAGKTDAEVRTEQADRVGKPTGNTRQVTRNGTTVKETEYVLPDGTTTWRSQSESVQPDQVGKPTGNTREATRDGQKVKETEYLLPDGTKEWRRQEVEDPGSKPIPAGVKPFTPDPNDPNLDYGLSAYNEYLRDLERKGVIDRTAGKELIERAGQSATIYSQRENQQVGRAQTARSQDISQRGQDLGEVASRRSTATGLYQNLSQLYNTGAQKVMSGDEGLAAEAFRSALNLGLSNARRWGGMNDVPQVPAAYAGAMGAPDPATAGTQVTVHPTGHVEVSPPGSPPPGALPDPIFRPMPPAAYPGGPAAGPPARDDWRTNPGAAPVNPAYGQPGNDPTRPVGMAPSSPYVAAMGGPSPAAPPAFTPDFEALRSQGFTDDEIAQAWSEHQQEMAGAA
jgi:hypothetical protein